MKGTILARQATGKSSAPVCGTHSFCRELHVGRGTAVYFFLLFSLAAKLGTANLSAPSFLASLETAMGSER